ncbi:hypothetical protein BZM27_48100 [Paraburkholderia steynii]|uniref:TIR domain-containing protein n=1 Tax=Paraburkholderia steynii TaxID=1245441 RepID=A0A4R0X515_9BURK|nr:hypothetical protein BZM27_48100 [Paraburkholderia steynii]
MTEPSERFWDDLLLFIEERKVIPVVGPELVTLCEGNQNIPIHRWVARRLVEILELPAGELPEGFDLNDAVALHLRRHGEREELYARIYRILRNNTLAPSEPLMALAAIPGFDLFVSLTFDSILSDAIAQARGGLRPEQIAYSTNAVRDLSAPRTESRQPVVFHLLGRASSSPEYAICDEDLLEFLHALQDRQRQPHKLFDELRGNHLLILGCGFGDWLARFFLRTARSLELSQKRKRWEIFADGQIASDPGLTVFFESFSAETRVLQLTAAQFVNELTLRWTAAHPPEAPGASALKDVHESVALYVPQGAVFLSYARENLEVASRLADGLRMSGLDVWFDKNALHVGEDFARSIRHAIEGCSLFLPVLSHEALSEYNRRRYFWREWNEADDFAKGMAPDETFIIPIVVDETRIDRSALPETFKRSHGASLMGGTLTPDAAAWLKQLVRDFHRRQRAA